MGNLSYNVSEDDLKTMFSEFGEVDNVRIITDKFSGQSKGSGFIEIPSSSEADKAIKALNGKLIRERNIKVNQANPGGKRTTRKKDIST